MPISLCGTGNKEQCTDLLQVDNFYFCGNYQERPRECANHDFPSKFCPIGLSKLGISANDLDTIRSRIGTGWTIIKNGFWKEV